MASQSACQWGSTHWISGIPLFVYPKMRWFLGVTNDCEYSKWCSCRACYASHMHFENQHSFWMADTWPVDWKSSFIHCVAFLQRPVGHPFYLSYWYLFQIKKGSNQPVDWLLLKLSVCIFKQQHLFNNMQCQKIALFQGYKSWFELITSPIGGIGWHSKERLIYTLNSSIC